MEVLRREIASRRRDGSLRQRGDHGGDDMDFLQSLLLRSQQQQAGTDDEALLTDEQILDNILTLIIAGMCLRSDMLELSTPAVLQRIIILRGRLYILPACADYRPGNNSDRSHMDGQVSC
jgi:cytochrome P450